MLPAIYLPVTDLHLQKHENNTVKTTFFFFFFTFKQGCDANTICTNFSYVIFYVKNTKTKVDFK